MKTIITQTFDSCFMHDRKEIRREIQNNLPMGYRLCSIIEHKQEPVLSFGEVIFHQHIAKVRVSISAKKGRDFVSK